MPTTMTREAVGAKLCQLAAEQGAVSPADVTLDTHLFNDLNFDSLDAVEFVMRIEEEFDVSISDEQSEDVRTVRQALELLLPIVCVHPD